MRRVLAAINGAAGHPEKVGLEFSSAGRIVGELEDSIRKGLGATRLMSFVQLTMAPSCRKATGHDKTQVIRLVIGNLFMMQETPKHVPDAGPYAPVTVVFGERCDGVHRSRDSMTGVLPPCGNSGAHAVARNLDKKVRRPFAGGGGFSWPYLR